MLKYYFGCITINNGNMNSFNNLLMACIFGWNPQTCKMFVYILAILTMISCKLTSRSLINLNCVDKSI